MNKNYTPNEVATLLEDLRGDFRAVVEVVAPIPGRLTAVEERLSAVENRLTGVEDVVRIAIPSLTHRVSALEAKTGV